MKNFFAARVSARVMFRHATVIAVVLSTILAGCLADTGDPIIPEEADDAIDSDAPHAESSGVPAVDRGAVGADSPGMNMDDARSSDDGPDAELFDQAMSARAAGDAAGMKQTLLQLVRDHPNSPLVPHAYLAFGDHMFEVGRMAEAHRFYERAARFGGSTGPYARYRIAWCHLNDGDDTAALEAFVAAARAGRDLGTTHGNTIARASLRDSVHPFARVGRLDRAAAFYRRFVLDPADLDPLLLHLAEAARIEGRDEELEKICNAVGSRPWCSTP